MASVKQFNSINVNDIALSDPKPNSRGGQTVWLSHNGEKIIIQIPKGKCPFGLNHQQFDDGQPKYDVSVSLGGTEKMDEFNKWVSAFDEHICKVAEERSPILFGKKKSAEVIEEMYKTMKIPSKKGDYAPTMKFKLPYYDGKHVSTIFDDKREERSVDIITKGVNIVLIAQLTSMWFVGKQFGVTWQVMQAKVYPQTSLPSYAFADDDDDDDEDTQSTNSSN